MWRAAKERVTPIDNFREGAAVVQRLDAEDPLAVYRDEFSRAQDAKSFEEFTEERNVIP